MAIPAYARARNIRLTVQQRIGDSITVATVTGQGAAQSFAVPVIHSFRWADPEAVRDPAATGDRAYVITQWLADGAGKRLPSTLQADVYCRTRPPGSSQGDAFGLVAADVADHLVDLFRGERAGGHGAGEGGMLKAWLPILDFTTPTSPVSTGRHLRCVTPGGQEGMPSEVRSLGEVNGYQRVVVRWSFRTIPDGTSPDFVYA